MNALPTTLAGDLADDAGGAAGWLIDGLWAERAVGVLGGEPKCYKSFLALDAAVSVASGRPCLGQFAVPRPGPALVYPAEDSLTTVRRRLAGIAAARGTSLAGLPVHVITAPRVRLDSLEDRRRLSATVERVRPRLVVLDPLIRLHSIDENVAAEVAPILGYLRELERLFSTGIMLVHHARKDSRGTRPGQALRGTSDLHGWGDSNLYLRRAGSRLLLSIEHRAAPGRDNLAIELAEGAQGPALRLADAAEAAPDPPRAAREPAERVLGELLAASGPLSAQDMLRRCRMRAATFWRTLAELLDGGRIERTPEERYRLPA
jgi:hypothetical protein